MAHANPIASEGPILFAGDLRFDKGVTVLLAAYEQLSDPPPLFMAGQDVPRHPPSSCPRGRTCSAPFPRRTW